jgi:hypothetical protein
VAELNQLMGYQPPPLLIIIFKDKWETGKHKLKIQLFIRYSSVIDLYGNIIEESYL